MASHKMWYIQTGALSSCSAAIHEKTGCNIAVEERDQKIGNHVWLTVSGEQGKATKKAVELVENCLVGTIGAEEARGRLLYDMALSCDGARPDGALLQRNPLNSFEKVWMWLVDLPAEVHDGELKFSFAPFAKGAFVESLHGTSCTVKICRESFGVKLSFCRPYVMIFGSQVKSVSQAIVITKNALKQYKQLRVVQISQCMSKQAGLPSQIGGAMSSLNTMSKKANPKPIIMTLPSWLVSTESFRYQIEGTFFSSFRASLPLSTLNCLFYSCCPFRWAVW